MPKLTDEDLRRRFPCSFCGRSFRTRQGLSGHVQFKHSPRTIPVEKDPAEILSEALRLKQDAMLSGFSEEEALELFHITSFWRQIETLFKNKHIALNDTDFKNYLIVSLSHMRSDQRLMSKIQKELGTAVRSLPQILANLVADRFNKSS